MFELLTSVDKLYRVNITNKTDRNTKIMSIVLTGFLISGLARSAAGSLLCSILCSRFVSMVLQGYQRSMGSRI